jgi:LysM repeat protein
MDTISSENNNSLLPMIAAILGGLAVLLSAIALFKLSSVSKQIAKAEGAATRIESIEQQVAQTGNAVNDIAAIRNYVTTMERQVNQQFANVRNEFNTVRAEINTVKEATARRPAQQTTGVSGGQGQQQQQQQQQATPVASPGEYVVQSGDTGVKIARSNGVNLNDLIAVNPDINWNRLRVGQKVKIPKK